MNMKATQMTNVQRGRSTDASRTPMSPPDDFSLRDARFGEFESPPPRAYRRGIRCRGSRHIGAAETLSVADSSAAPATTPPGVRGCALSFAFGAMRIFQGQANKVYIDDTVNGRLLQSIEHKTTHKQ